jgi:hypothetical protein
MSSTLYNRLELAIPQERSDVAEGGRQAERVAKMCVLPLNRKLNDGRTPQNECIPLNNTACPPESVPPSEMEADLKDSKGPVHVSTGESLMGELHGVEGSNTGRR